VSRKKPQSDCIELAFQAAYPVTEAAQAALEDYASALTGARAAEACRRADDPAMVAGVHVCGPVQVLTQPVVNDLEDFARSLVMERRGGGMGWT
jgi:hypothetical protein